MKTTFNRPKLWIENHLQAASWKRRLISNWNASRPSRGFSLVEVVLAIGLTTFALLVMFSLLPVGLNTMQDANRQIVESEIFNTLGSEISSTKFGEPPPHTNDLDAYVTSTRFPMYFDNEGLPVTDPAKAVFTVRCALAPAAASDLSGQIKRVIVSIGYHKDPDKLSDADAFKRQRTFVVADRGI